MSKGTARRTVRIEDGLWEAAQEKASDRGDFLSDIIRDALRRYLDAPEIQKLREDSKNPRGFIQQ